MIFTWSLKKMEQIIVSLGVFSLCLAFSIVLTFLSMKVAVRIGFLDHPKGRKKHEKPIPLLGGVGFYSAVVLGVYIPAIVLSLYSESFVRMFPFQG